MDRPYSQKTIMLMQLHYSRLMEKDRRQYAALEAMRLEKGGISYISNVLSIDRGTILQGIKELTTPSLELPGPGRQRRAGGGRKKKPEIS